MARRASQDRNQGGLSPDRSGGGGGARSAATPSSRPNTAAAAESSNSTNTADGALAMLADASLAAELDGSKEISGLDPTFKFSSLTQALEAAGENTDVGSSMSPGRGLLGKNVEAPPLLTKGIVDANTVVELFRM